MDRSGIYIVRFLDENGWEEQHEIENYDSKGNSRVPSKKRIREYVLQNCPGADLSSIIVEEICG